MSNHEKAIFKNYLTQLSALFDNERCLEMDLANPDNKGAYPLIKASLDRTRKAIKELDHHYTKSVRPTYPKAGILA